jgi:prolipoprotein diacylglyceryltransferase
MTDELAFIAVLSVAMAALLAWSLRNLAADRWQIIAALPVAPQGPGRDEGWRGVNFTYYGFFLATAITLSAALALTLAASIGVGPVHTTLLIVPLLGVGVYASGLVARVLEKKASTFTVVGAVVIVLVLTPWHIVLVDRLEALWTDDTTARMALPVLPLMAVFAVAQCFGEAIGRLGCVSFGCCYGTPVRESGLLGRRLFTPMAFAYHSHTKKAVYEGRHAGEKLVPIQGVTATICVLVGLLGAALFLAGRYGLALLLTVGLTQGWRVLSEYWRADVRRLIAGLSAYQWIALAALPYVTLCVWLLRDAQPPIVHLRLGLTAMWDPAVILSLQALWLATFYRYGKSSVTGSTVTFHLR